MADITLNSKTVQEKECHIIILKSQKKNDHFIQYTVINFT